MTTAAAIPGAIPDFVRRSRVMLAVVLAIATLAAVVEVPHAAAPPQAHAAAFA